MSQPPLSLNKKSSHNVTNINEIISLADETSKALNLKKA
jgi:hypothetical protein